jgi:type II secretory pathway pseudopilin PulG
VPTRLSSTRILTLDRPARRGFSFTEILFAVMILGIGFIMIAAIFPVALQQTETSQAETVGAAVARAGVSFVGQAATSTFVNQKDSAAAVPIPMGVLRPTLPLTVYPDDYLLAQSCQFGVPTAMPAAPASSYPELIGEVWSFDWDSGNPDTAVYVNNQKLGSTQLLSNVLWPIMAQNMIQMSDPRYAWVAFYRRNIVQTSASPVLYSYSPSAQVIMIALQSRAKQFYDQSDLLLPTGTNPPVSIQPSRGAATIAPSPSSLNYTIQFSTANSSVLPQRAAAGAFVIIASDGLAPGTPNAGVLNGHIYRLGIQSPNDPTIWEFAPGFGPVAGTSEATAIGTSYTFQVYMVGKAQDPTNAGQYTGLAQDIAAYSTFISCPAN